MNRASWSKIALAGASSAVLSAAIVIGCGIGGGSGGTVVTPTQPPPNLNTPYPRSTPGHDQWPEAPELVVVGKPPSTVAPRGDVLTSLRPPDPGTAARTGFLPGLFTADMNYHHMTPLLSRLQLWTTTAVSVIEHPGYGFGAAVYPTGMFKKAYPLDLSGGNLANVTKFQVTFEDGSQRVFVRNPNASGTENQAYDGGGPPLAAEYVFYPCADAPPWSGSCSNLETISGGLLYFKGGAPSSCSTLRLREPGHVTDFQTRSQQSSYDPVNTYFEDNSWTFTGDLPTNCATSGDFTSCNETVHTVFCYSGSVASGSGCDNTHAGDTIEEIRDRPVGDSSSFVRQSNTANPPSAGTELLVSYENDQFTNNVPLARTAAATGGGQVTFLYLADIGGASTNNDIPTGAWSYAQVDGNITADGGYQGQAGNSTVTAVGNVLLSVGFPGLSASVGRNSIGFSYGWWGFFDGASFIGGPEGTNTDSLMTGASNNGPGFRLDLSSDSAADAGRSLNLGAPVMVVHLRDCRTFTASADPNAGGGYGFVFTPADSALALPSRDTETLEFSNNTLPELSKTVRGALRSTSYTWQSVGGELGPNQVTDNIHNVAQTYTFDVQRNLPTSIKKTSSAAGPGEGVQITIQDGSAQPGQAASAGPIPNPPTAWRQILTVQSLNAAGTVVETEDTLNVSGHTGTLTYEMDKLGNQWFYTYTRSSSQLTPTAKRQRFWESSPITVESDSYGSGTLAHLLQQRNMDGVAGTPNATVAQTTYESNWFLNGVRDNVLPTPSVTTYTTNSVGVVFPAQTQEGLRTALVNSVAPSGAPIQVQGSYNGSTLGSRFAPTNPIGLGDKGANASLTGIFGATGNWTTTDDPTADRLWNGVPNSTFTTSFSEIDNDGYQVGETNTAKVNITRNGTNPYLSCGALDVLRRPHYTGDPDDAIPPDGSAPDAAPGGGPCGVTCVTCSGKLPLNFTVTDSIGSNTATWNSTLSLWITPQLSAEEQSGVAACNMGVSACQFSPQSGTPLYVYGIGCASPGHMQINRYWYELRCVSPAYQYATSGCAVGSGMQVYSSSQSVAVDCDDPNWSGDMTKIVGNLSDPVGGSVQMQGNYSDYFYGAGGAWCDAGPDAGDAGGCNPNAVCCR